MEEYDIDPQVLAGFIDETIENLESAEQMFINLEENPDDMDIVNAIFRPIHSLKGTSGFFGLIKTKELSHAMENLLDALRKGEKRVSKEIINVLLKGIDQLGLIFQRIRSGEKEIEDEAKYEKVKALVDEALTLGAAPVQYVEPAPSEPADILGELIDRLSTIRPVVPEHRVSVIDDAMELLFEMSAENEAEQDKEDAARRELQALMGEDLSGAAEITPAAESEGDSISPAAPESGRAISDDSAAPGAGSSRKEMESTPPDAVEEKRKGERRSADERRKSDRRGKKSAESDKTMRVSEKSIDSFLEYVGELVVVEEMFNYLQKKLASLSLDQNISKNFRRVIETFSTLSEGLRNSILEIRSVPAQILLQKAPRIIRIVADEAGKEVDVTIEGETIRIDKSYLELLDAPLTHMVRNAVDHGLETPSERLAMGKPAKGSVRIAIRENRDIIELVVSEDGRGLNLDAISAKAVEIGLIGRGQKLEKEKIIELLFMSGVSTAKEITDISGRGVGMDVVKKNIDSAGGSISVETLSGEGTTFKITLPKSVSTQIVDGFLVRSGAEIYVLPMEIVGESFVPEPKDISTVSGGKAEMVLRRGVLMRVVHLASVLGASEERSAAGDAVNRGERVNKKVMITVEMERKNYALCVDDILGVQKVVVKHVDALPVESDYFEGAAMMGDGSVAMIISVDAMKEMASDG